MRSASRWVIEVGYVVTVAALAAFATSNPTDFRRWAWGAVLVLCLPALIPMLPVLYVAASTAFNVTGADNGGTHWPVTATYVVVLTLAAILNVGLFRLITKTRHRQIRLDRSAP